MFDLNLFVDALIHQSPPHMLDHIMLVLIPLGIAITVGCSIGIVLTRPRFRWLTPQVMSILNAGQCIPPLAVIAIFLPFLGLGWGPAVMALTIYCLLPITRNTIAGLDGVSDEVKESAKGMGMSNQEVFWKVEVPLRLPVVLSGVKTSTVLTVGTAVLASLVGAGGMGVVIFAGIDFFQQELIVAGTLIIGAIAIFIERIITLIERIFVPKHLR